MALESRVNEAGDALGMDSHDELGTISGLLRSRKSGRFVRLTVARWRAREGLAVRAGRPSSVTPELVLEAKRLLAEGYSVEAMCARVGVAKSSWYRWVHAQARHSLRPYRRTRRHPRSIKPALVRQMVALDKQGLSRSAIAERLGLHINTVVKYLLREGRPRKKL